MNILLRVNTLLSLLVIGAVSFSLTHAKDITAANAIHNSNTTLSAARSLDNGIHVDFHPHVDRQSLPSLLKSAQNTQPISDSRSLKRTYHNEQKSHLALRDGLFGFHIPEYI